MVFNEGVVRSFQVSYCLLGEPLGVDARGGCLPRGCGVVSQGVRVWGHSVVLLLLGH
jgi:hypothetical protein